MSDKTSDKILEVGIPGNIHSEAKIQRKLVLVAILVIPTNDIHSKFRYVPFVKSFISVSSDYVPNYVFIQTKCMISAELCI